MASRPRTAARSRRASRFPGWGSLAAAPLCLLLGCTAEKSTVAAAPPADTPAVTRLQKPNEAPPQDFRKANFLTSSDSQPSMPDGRVAVHILAQVNGMPI